jgi:hypothetical protein
MPTPEEELQAERKKRSIVLLTCGSVTLILPLLVIVYMKVNESKVIHAPSASVTFDRREQGDAKVNVTQTVSIVNPEFQGGAPASSLPVAGGPTMVQSGSSSLDFVKGGSFPDKAAAAAAATVAAPAPPAPIVAPAPEPAPKTVASKKGAKRFFNSPKLQGTKTFSTFKAGNKATAAPAGNGGGAAAQAKGGGMDDMLKNVPGGAENPEVQKYLKSHGQ